MRDNSLNILLIASWYPSMEDPTSGSFVQEQAHMLRDFGHQVTVIHPFMLGSFAKSITKQSYQSFSTEDGIRVLRVGVSPPAPLFRSLSYRYCYFRVKKALKKHQFSWRKFDVIHSHSVFMGGYIAQKLSDELQIPFVHTEHASGLFFNPNQYTSTDKRLLQSIYSSARNVLFVSHYSLNNTIDILKISDSSRFSVVPNLINADFFKESINRGSKPTNFLMVGDFIPVKNHELLLRAWKTVQTKYTDIKLTLIGDCIDEIELAKRFPELNFDLITIIPRLGRQALCELMKSHDVVLSSSLVETFGLSIAESQALGIPAVVTNSGGVTDIISPETGIVTEPNVEAFGKGIFQMIDTFDSFDASRIRQLAMDRFSPPVIMQQLNAIYAKVL
ncbi:MAG: glycosyltransferase [Flavobacteriales bacterium]